MFPLEPIADCWNIDMEVTSFDHSIYISKTQGTCLCWMLCKTSVTPVVMKRRQLYAKLNIGGKCLNENSKSKLIKLYNCNDKFKQLDLHLKNYV